MPCSDCVPFGAAITLQPAPLFVDSSIDWAATAAHSVALAHETPVISVPDAGSDSTVQAAPPSVEVMMEEPTATQFAALGHETPSSSVTDGGTGSGLHCVPP